MSEYARNLYRLRIGRYKGHIVRLLTRPRGRRGPQNVLAQMANGTEVVCSFRRLESLCTAETENNWPLFPQDWESYEA